MVVVSAISLIRSTSLPVLFSSYQNKKCALDEVSIHVVTLVFDLKYTCVQYDKNHFY